MFETFDNTLNPYVYPLSLRVSHILVTKNIDPYNLL
jgi:hypothetical protein